MVYKACRKCRKIVEDGEQDEDKTSIKECPICGGNTFTTFWKGNALIVDPENSDIAKAMDVKTPGRYALRLSR
ncbi:MAG: transcription elongation factor subunit Spt4 [archaeon]|jgi:DNA-directed RNA polymerase subunit E"